MHVYMQYSTGCVDINIYSDKGVYTRVCIRTYRHTYMYVHAYILIQVNAIRIIPYALSFVLIDMYLYTHFPSPTSTELERCVS